MSKKVSPKNTEMDFVSDPTVACILFPAEAPNLDVAAERPISEDNVPEKTPKPFRAIELLLSQDYGTGKLIRSGLDAVHGRSCTGRRIYDPQAVRKGLSTIDDLVGPDKRDKSARKVLTHQGHGNIGLNNWAVAVQRVKPEEPPRDRLIAPAGEALHERIYSCFIKRGPRKKPSYEIQDVVFFCDPWIGDRYETVDWDPSTKAPRGAVMIEDTDREVQGEAVYLPIWHQGLAGRAFTTYGDDSRIDWTGVEVRFARIPRGCEGIVDTLKLRLVPVPLGEKPQSFHAPLNEVHFAFFGIPVEGLALDPIGEGSQLSQAAHYFYDLRHLIDLIGMGQPEFHLLEYELKRNQFQEAQRFLDPSANRFPLTVDLKQLRDLVAGDNPKSPCLDASHDLLSSPEKLRQILVDKGYTPVDASELIAAEGDFWIDPPTGSGSGTEVSKLHIYPRRNCYSYSFVGTVTGPGDKPYVLLAVTGGLGGVRPRSLGGQTVFSKALRTSFQLEDAVRTIFDIHLTRLWGNSGWTFDRDTVGDQHRLLLLDQGGDVHQWVATGGVRYVVGSSEGRSLMSAIVAVLEGEEIILDEGRSASGREAETY